MFRHETGIGPICDCRVAVPEELRHRLDGLAGCQHPHCDAVPDLVDVHVLEVSTSKRRRIAFADGLDAITSPLHHVVGHSRLVGRLQRRAGHAVHWHYGPALASEAIGQAQIDDATLHIDPAPSQIEDGAHARTSGQQQDHSQPDMWRAASIQERPDLRVGKWSDIAGGFGWLLNEWGAIDQAGFLCPPERRSQMSKLGMDTADLSALRGPGFRVASAVRNCDLVRAQISETLQHGLARVSHRFGGWLSAKVIDVG